MANPSITTLYAGDVVEELMQLAVTQNETVDGGHIYVSTDIRFQRSIQRLTMTDIIQPFSHTPQSRGQFSADNRLLKPDNWMVYIEFLPDEFRDFWDFGAPTGSFNFHELAPSVQMAMLKEILEGENGVNPYMGQAIWQGDKTLDPNLNVLGNFDGLLIKAAADADVIDVAGTTITEGNVQAELRKLYNASPEVMRQNPNYKIFVSVADWELYADSVINTSGKGPLPTDEVRKRFKEKTIVPLVGMPKNHVKATIGSATRESNIWLGVTATVDFDTITVDRVQNNSDYWFFKMKMGADTQIKWGERFVDYRP